MEYVSEDIQLDKGIHVFREALKSKFYAGKYAGMSLPRSLADWENLPVLTRGEIYEHSFPHSTDMLTQPVEDAIIISTGGSSGIARYTTYTHPEWDLFVECQAAAMRILGVTREDRVANLFIAGHFWPSFLGLHDVIKKIGAVHLPISGNIPMEEIVKLCLKFEPTVMVSLPTFFVFLADMAARDRFKFDRLRMINYAGEHLSSAAEAHVSAALGVRRIKAGAYTSADAGIMGYQCDHTGPGVYHVPTAFQRVELIDFEKGSKTNPGEAGEVVVTNLSRVSTPIIRYRVGDAASWTGEKCPCGDPNPLLKLAGRAGQDFKLGGGFISLDVFENCIAAHADSLSLNFQLEILDVDNQFEMVLRIEAPVKPDPAVVARLEKELFEAVPELGISAEKGYLKNFAIEVAELGKLPRSPITGKVAKLVDRRVL
jgi:phenylacetate-CoA ligase